MRQLVGTAHHLETSLPFLQGYHPYNTSVQPIISFSFSRHLNLQWISSGGCEHGFNPIKTHELSLPIKKMKEKKKFIYLSWIADEHNHNPYGTKTFNYGCWWLIIAPIKYIFFNNIKLSFYYTHKQLKRVNV